MLSLDAELGSFLRVGGILISQPELPAEESLAPVDLAFARDRPFAGFCVH